LISALSSSKLNIAANIPIAPMSPQLQNVRTSLPISQQKRSSSLHESKCLTQAKLSTHTSPNSSRRSQRTSITTTAAIPNQHYRPRQTNADSSAANSSSTSPINLSRSTSPAASIANFIRPISPPCIQVKEPLSPKFSRASSTVVTNHSGHDRHRSPPIIVPSIANNIDASTASATTILLIDDSSGYDSSENQTNRTNNILTAAAATSVISTVPESCFEPETYRNLYPFNSNQQKKLSLSDPTLNQTTKPPRHLQQTTTTTNSHLSASCLQRETSNDDEDIQTDDEIINLNTYEDILPKEKQTTHVNDSRKVSLVLKILIVNNYWNSLEIFKSSTSNDDMYKWYK
jgi:hypothetical protein